ncbi:MAG: DUF3365 domain-containing protein [Kastovskya adunca ATA6-11-RM4]|jgi:class 3 adenylate cyclase|nr:DUF3365 domain-containing protein [Kastovskya adunca ATA6-11-RM4]
MRKLTAQARDAFIQLLYKRTILILAILFCAGVGVAMSNMSRLSSNLIESQALQNATLYADAIAEARTLYSVGAVNRLADVHNVIITHDYATQENAIPLPATYLLELAKRLSEKNQGMSVRLYSDFPFPSRNKEGGPKDDFEWDALSALRKNSDQHFVHIEQFHGRRALRYAQADIMQASCVECHNTHPSSPKTDWKVGDVRGILEVTIPLDDFATQTKTALRGTLFALLFLSALALSGLTLVIGRLRRTSHELEKRVIERTAALQQTNAELKTEQEKSNHLLLNILPESIAQQLKDGKSKIAESFAEVTILFADIVGFTELSEKNSPAQLINLLNDIFSAFDRLSEEHKLEKIKTIGDAYMVVGGLPSRRIDHAEAIAEMALDMQQELARLSALHGANLNIRIGINTGPVVAGVIGTKKFIYDLWGDAVNTASRMESHGLAGCIQVTESTYDRLQDKYLFLRRGTIQVKGKGEMTTFLLVGKKVSQLVSV